MACAEFYSSEEAYGREITRNTPEGKKKERERIKEEKRLAEIEKLKKAAMLGIETTDAGSE